MSFSMINNMQVIEGDLIDNSFSSDKYELSQEQLDDMFATFCYRGELKQVKHLLTSSNFSIRPNIHAREDEAFRWLIEEEHLDVLQYLIFEHKMEKTYDMEEILKMISSDFSKTIDDLFNIRDLNLELKEELVVNDCNLKKVKL